jgi:formylglycine-generating enzyme required for sulfatase activity
LEEYDQFATATGRELPFDKGWGRGRLPVVNVTWNDAVAYGEWLSQQTGKRYRLPSEAEWEYSARAGTETEYWWGSSGKSRMASYRSLPWDIKQIMFWGVLPLLVIISGRQHTEPVGSFPRNPFGLYDTAGNVSEWVQDCWHDNYNAAPRNGSAWEAKGVGHRVIRGGSWTDEPRDLRSSARKRLDADDRNFYIGFRLARDID